MKMSMPDATTTPFVARFASWKVWVASAVFFVPFAWLFFASSAPFAIPEVEAACGQAPPDMRFFTSADGVTQFLEGCGTDGRDTYRRMQLADVFYPALVGVFMASSLSLAIRRLSPRSRRLLWLGALPLVATGFDYLENTLAWLALASYPDPIATSHLLGVASAAKTATSWMAGLALVAAVTAIVVRVIRSRVRAANSTVGVASARADEGDVIGSTR